MENLRSLAVIDRPREKLILFGANSLNDTELLAILLGSGSSDVPVHELAAHLLGQLKQLSTLSAWSADQLCTIKGIGPAKAAVLLAAAELSRRQRQQQTVIRISSDQEAIALVKPLFEQTGKLQYILVLLNQNRELLATAELQITDQKLPQINQIVTLVTDAGAYGFSLVRNTAPDEKNHQKNEAQSLTDLHAVAKMLRVRFFGLAIVPP